MNNTFTPFELKIIDLSITELLILQKLQKIKQQVTRYKLLQQIQQNTGKKSLSTAKFYRMLHKLEKLGFVSHKQSIQQLYFITPEGLKAIGASKSILEDTGKQVINLFANQIKDIIKFTRYENGKVLFIDFPELYDLSVLSTTNEVADELFVLSNENIITWLTALLKGVKQSRFEEQTIKEPDNIFNLIILFYPSFFSNENIFKEIFRVLKPEKHLLIVDSINPLELTDHYVVEILLDQYWPIRYNNKKSIYEVEKIISKIFNQRTPESLSSKGLELRLFTKN